MVDALPNIHVKDDIWKDKHLPIVDHMDLVIVNKVAKVRTNKIIIILVYMAVLGAVISIDVRVFDSPHLENQVI